MLGCNANVFAVHNQDISGQNYGLVPYTERQPAEMSSFQPGEGT